MTVRARETGYLQWNIICQYDGSVAHVNSQHLRRHKSCTRSSSQSPSREREGPMKSLPHLRSYEPLMAAGVWESAFSLGMLALKRYPCCSRWSHIHTYTGRTRWTQWAFQKIIKIKKNHMKLGEKVRKKDRKETAGERSGGKTWLKHTCTYKFY